ncbi:MAG: metallophosphoesterase, partial [Planctomycetota bacterium]
HLKRLTDSTGLPVWFVLGNHDFYHADIATTRLKVSRLSEEHPGLCYLTGSNPATSDNAKGLPANWAICGDDGWADARIGDYYRSPVRMLDYELIHDFSNLNSQERLVKIQSESVASAVRLRQQLESSRQVARNQLVLTHIPPAREACWYDGRHSDDAWAPYFTCTAVGWMLRRYCRRYPEQRVLVLCGHTHGSGTSLLAHNLAVWTGAAVEGVPQLNSIIEFDRFPSVSYDWTFSESFRKQSNSGNPHNRMELNGPSLKAGE